MNQSGGKGGMKRRNVPARITFSIFIYLHFLLNITLFLLNSAVLFEKNAIY